MRWYEVLGWVLAALSAVPAVAQLVRTVRSRCTDGVSAATHVA